ncbi:Topoisomerase 1-associated factor 1, partial [Spiromyces aspiralis]
MASPHTISERAKAAFPLEAHFEYQEQLERYRNIVLSVCTALGGLERQPAAQSAASSNGDGSSEGKLVYVPGDECVDCLRDLRRFIRRDEQSKDKQVLRWLGDWGILERDLLPIFVLSVDRIQRSSNQIVSGNHDDDDDDDNARRMVMLCIELFVFVTWPMESETMETQVAFRRILRGYKRAFASHKVITALLTVLTGPI